MRKSLLMSAALLGMSAGVALAQNAVGGGQTPPSPGAASQGPQSINSMPAGAATSSTMTPGANLGAAAVAPAASASAPMPGGKVVQGSPSRSGMRRGPYVRAQRGATGAYVEQDAPPASAYRGGAGSPFSTQASNTSSANARTEMAPRLPDPGATANTPEALLTAAQRSLRAGRTGAAQEALERAETRILSRTTDPSMAGAPDDAAMVRHIGEARRALGNRDKAGADAAIAAAMAAPVPPRGPTVTYQQPTLGAPPVGYVQPGYAPAPAYAPQGTVAPRTY